MLKNSPNTDEIAVLMFSYMNTCIDQNLTVLLLKIDHVINFEFSLFHSIIPQVDIYCPCIFSTGHLAAKFYSKLAFAW